MPSDKYESLFAHLSSHYSGLEPKKNAFLQAMASCSSATSSERFLSWFANAYAQFFSDSPTLLCEINKVDALQESECVSYQDLQQKKLSKSEETHLLNQLVVVKLNGGLGTSMGCDGPKSLVKLNDDLRFIDMIRRQKQGLMSKTLPRFVLMNSFHTSRFNTEWKADFDVFEQHKIPRILIHSGDCLSDLDVAFTPPGHGDIFLTLYEQGLLDQWLAEGRTHMFVSNSDNLGATVAEFILQHMIENKQDMLMEVTAKTPSDIKGGALAKDAAGLRLIERTQVAKTDLKDFEDIHVFSLFNTNNCWFRIEAIKAAVEANALQLPPIMNIKTVGNQEVVQFESAMGAALSVLPNTACVLVERDRFFPVKTTNDLFLLRSNIVKLNADGSISRLTKGPLPQIDLGPAYKNLDDFNRLVSQVPDISKLKSLQVKGAVDINSSTCLEGHVTLEAST